MSHSVALLKYPLRLSVDNITDHMWGGHWIRRFKNLPPSTSPVGEAWELSARPEYPSRIEPESGGGLLSDVVRDHAPLLLGSRVVREHGAHLPLLLKFIDAADDLSVQVHPDDSHMPEGQCGKSEAWRILDVAPGEDNGFIYLGFDPRKAESYPTAAAFSEAFFGALSQANSMGPSDNPAVRARAERLVLPFLNKIKVRAGDVFEVRPGVVHAIGRGIRLFEIQQPSDTTYRVWDWNRPDAKERAHGRLAFRPLHTKEAMKVLDLRADNVAPVARRALGPMEWELVNEAKGRFLLTEITLAVNARHRLETNDVFQALTVIKGSVEIGGVKAETGRTVLVPAAMLETTITAQEPSTVLRSTVPF